jgi:pyruvate decarboxylase
MTTLQSNLVRPHLTTNPVLRSLLHHISNTSLPVVSVPKLPPISHAEDSTKVLQSYIWRRLGKFLKPGDVVLAESGTAQFGMPDAPFPANITYITQQFYSSIGYTVGAALGAALALREKKGENVDYMPDQGEHSRGQGRVVLLVGDGSLQMTVQEIGTMIKCGLKPIMFVP